MPNPHERKKDMKKKRRGHPAIGSSALTHWALRAIAVTRGDSLPQGRWGGLLLGQLNLWSTEHPVYTANTHCVLILNYLMPNTLRRTLTLMYVALFLTYPITVCLTV